MWREMKSRSASSRVSRPSRSSATSSHSRGVSPEARETRSEHVLDAGRADAHGDASAASVQARGLDDRPAAAGSAHPDARGPLGIFAALDGRQPADDVPDEARNRIGIRGAGRIERAEPGACGAGRAARAKLRVEQEDAHLGRARRRALPSDSQRADAAHGRGGPRPRASAARLRERTARRRSLRQKRKSPQLPRSSDGDAASSSPTP